MKRLETTLMKMMRRLRSLFTFSFVFGFASSIDAITWGMPLPPAKGANFLTSHQAIMKQAGSNGKMRPTMKPEQGS